jgi:hypothetical protein
MKFCFCISVLFFYFQAQSQVYDDSRANIITDNNGVTLVRCYSRWEKNDSFKLAIAKQSESTRDARSVVATTATVKVIDKTATGYVLAWTYSSFNIIEGQLTPTESLRALYQKRQILYAVKKDGSYDSLVNYEELRRHLDGSLEELSKQIPGSGQEVKLGKAIAATKSLVGSRASLERFLAREIRLYHYAYGRSFRIDKADSLTFEAPGPLIDWVKFATTRTWSARNLNKEKGTTELIIDEEINKDIATQTLARLMQEFAKQTNRMPGADALPSSFAVNERMTYSHRFADGMITRAQVERLLEADNLQRLETIVIELKQ